MHRRNFLYSIAALGTSSIAIQPLAAEASLEMIRADWRSLLPGNVSLPDATDLVQIDDAIWQQRLTEQQYRVMRHEDTERPYSSKLNDEYRPGVYLCAACDLPLFSSEMKFDAGTGWPSFFTSIPGSLETREDRFLFLSTTEYHCRRCGGHQGHIFDDGPRPTQERWCNNGIALRFLPKDG